MHGARIKVEIHAGRTDCGFYKKIESLQDGGLATKFGGKKSTTTRAAAA